MDDNGHDCIANSKVIQCIDGEDTRECKVCGKIWVENCMFEIDHEDTAMIIGGYILLGGILYA